VLLFDPSSKKRTLAREHVPWLVSCLVVGLLALIAYGLQWVVSGVQPPASSPLGLVSGVTAGALMIYLFLYALRKLPVFREVFRYKTNFWLRMHVWLGLLTVPLALVHGGRITHWGWLTFFLVLVYVGVIVSGVWGIIRQQYVPTRLLEEVPDETIRSEIPHLTERLRQEAELLVLATCGPGEPGTGPAVVPPSLKDHRDLIRNAARHPGKVAGVLAALPLQEIEGCEPLRSYFRDVIDPYLRPNSAGRSRLFLRARMDQDFDDLRGRLPDEAEDVIDALRSVCEQRRQFEEQEALHNKLHRWVSVHLVLSALLVVLLVSHVASAFIYW